VVYFFTGPLPFLPSEDRNHVSDGGEFFRVP